jgi:purine-binding chemotaxis protein CheW
MRRYLVVEAGGERWAIPSDAVVEVVEDPPIEAMPALPDRVRGVLAHRGAWLPVLDLARAMDLGAVEGGGAALIMDRGTTGYALLIERALGTTERDGDEHEWTDAAGVVSALDVENLFQAPAPAPGPGEAGAAANAAEGPGSVVCFRVGDVELAFLADDVDRIWPYGEPEPVAGLPEYVVGVLSVRGYAMPILDLGRHIGIEPLGGNERRVLVLGREDQRIGWVVDEVLAVAPFAADHWSDLPSFLGGRPARLVAAVVRRDEGRPMLVLRADALLDADQREVLQGSQHAE